MKKAYPITLFFLCLILNSCQSKQEIQQNPIINYSIQNYKLDDDEIERRKAADTLAKEVHSKEEKMDTLHTTKK